MKKLFVLMVLLAGLQQVNAQSAGYLLNGGSVKQMDDSLKSYTDTTASDTSATFVLGMKYHSLMAAITDTGASLADSVKFYLGIRKWVGGVCVDTMWSSAISVKKVSDMSTWINVASGANTETLYFLGAPVADLIKADLVNTGGGVVKGRRALITIFAQY